MVGDTPDQGEGRIIGGRYRLLRTLGAGGMGRVWLAYDAELACEVSMKEIALPDVPMDASEPAQRIARARSEARNAARLRGHPHVATVHDVVVHDGLPWIVMEYVPDAVDLQAVVRRSGPLAPAQTARIGLAVLDALAAGHRIGILHRDVKPANILLAPDATGDPYARVLLTDYGIALQPESREPRLTATAGILGTPGYLAPERARGEPPTPAADMFSLGATLYATVEGRGPFDRHGDYATLTALLSEEPTPPVRAGELTPVLQGLLVKDPVRRFAPEAVSRGLERVVQGTASPGFGPPQTPPPMMGAPLSPPTPGGAPPYQAAHTPRTPQTPQTPHTPAGMPPVGPATPGSTPLGAPAATPGGPSAYDAWRQPGPRGPYDAWNPYASEPTPPYSHSGAPTQVSGGAPPPYQGGPSGPQGGRRGLPGGALVAIAVAAVLVIGGGAWAAVSLAGGGGDTAGKKTPSSSRPETTKQPTGPVLPYGEQVGLDKPLQAGDCVTASWSAGEPFKSAPNLGVVDCTEFPDGQVVAVDSATDYADAQAQGAQRCEQQGKAIAEALPDAGVYALMPTKDGFSTADRSTACLVLGKHAAIGGEVGRFRDAGTALRVGQMSNGDCWMYKEDAAGDSYTATLVDCDEPHTDQMVGTVKAPTTMTYDKGLDQATKLCGNKFESTWAPGADRMVYGYTPNKDSWNHGFNTVVCAVSQVDGSETSGKIPAPGAV